MKRTPSSLLVGAAACAALLAGLSACAPTVGRHGFQPVDARPTDIVAGTDTRETVLSRLGSPSTVTTFDNDIWYYISQTTERYTYNRPQVSQRQVVAIHFNERDQVSDVRVLGLEDGQSVAMNSRETPTRGRQLTILEQLLGNVGRGQLPNTEENDPGRRRPD
ncbi:MAG: outer membrane protein assembly factor BamE [Brevundimonas sp.]|uniref:outer membrane protein assembly factor BamE n=1 Tax=Brevundimonas sp. TaxID=1871086 RepID=UPI00391DA702